MLALDQGGRTAQRDDRPQVACLAYVVDLPYWDEPQHDPGGAAVGEAAG
jgi:hypothetical protein